MLLKKEEKSLKSIKNFISKLEKKIYVPVDKLKTQAWITKEPVPYDKRREGGYVSLEEGDRWGELFDCAWFNFTGSIGKKYYGKHIVLLIDVSGEGLIVDETGNPLRGITSVTSRDEWPLGMWGKRVFEISEHLTCETKIDIWMDGGCNDLEGQYKNEGRLKQARIAVCNDSLRSLYYDFAVLANFCEALIEENNDSFRNVLNILVNAKAACESDAPNSFHEAKKILNQLFCSGEKESGFQFSSIGHAHIDLIFLWPLRETVRKGARTYSTVLDLMERYDDKYNYLFGCSQPQMYELIRKNHPSLFERIKEKINEGRWECQGAMWVETDTNIPSGESLVRQILYGKRYFRKMFGKEINVCFLPDVFGYSGALPQILEKSGVKYFLTQKLNMNDTNVFPHNTFIWKGIDNNSSVVAHMPPENTYNSPAVPQIVKFGERNFKNKRQTSEAMQLFGVGDGGGGPGPEHIERLIRLSKIKGIPKITPRFTEEFFERISADREKLPFWIGELYFERHRGTYTTQAKSKYFNRKMENTLRECEFALSLDNILNDSSYPCERLEEIWREVLLYQFHDVLPGSSIKRVYEESHERYEILLRQTEDLTDAAYKNIIRNTDTSNMKTPIMVFNSLSFERDCSLEIMGRKVKVKVPPMGYRLFDAGKLEKTTKTPMIKNRILENDFLKITFACDASLDSIYDKINEREVLKASGNRIEMYEDDGDCWDLYKEYMDKKPQRPVLKRFTPFKEPGTAGYDTEYTIGESKISQRIVLHNDSARLDFVTKVNWRETKKMLRTSFPVDVISDFAHCEIQFGHIKRPVHRNTSWDEAKFEICAHKWVDINDGGYGCALLNDCKYGYKVLDNILDLNLLRSQMCPEVDSDKGIHTFTYSLFPHSCDSWPVNVIKEGYFLNTPVKVFSPEEKEPSVLKPK